MSKLLNAKMTAMKKLRDTIEHYVLKAENRWKTLSVERQRYLTKVFFGGYVFLTLFIIVNVCITTCQRSNTMLIHHIDGISRTPQTKDTIQVDKINSLIKK